MRSRRQNCRWLVGRAARRRLSNSRLSASEQSLRQLSHRAGSIVRAASRSRSLVAKSARRHAEHDASDRTFVLRRSISSADQSALRNARDQPRWSDSLSLLHQNRSDDLRLSQRRNAQNESIFRDETSQIHSQRFRFDRSPTTRSLRHVRNQCDHGEIRRRKTFFRPFSHLTLRDDRKNVRFFVFFSTFAFVVSGRNFHRFEFDRCVCLSRCSSRGETISVR